MRGSTYRETSLQQFQEIRCHQELNLSNLSVCIQQPSMGGKKPEFVSSFKKNPTNLEKLIFLHCILQQQNDCIKSTILLETGESYCNG